MSTTYWEHFPHGADMGVRGIGHGGNKTVARAASPWQRA